MYVSDKKNGVSCPLSTRRSHPPSSSAVSLLPFSEVTFTAILAPLKVVPAAVGILVSLSPEYAASQLPSR